MVKKILPKHAEETEDTYYCPVTLWVEPLGYPRPRARHGRTIIRLHIPLRAPPAFVRRPYLNLLPLTPYTVLFDFAISDEESAV